MYGSPPGEEQEVARVEEEIVIEPVVGVEVEAVVEQVCMVCLNNVCIIFYFGLNLTNSGLFLGYVAASNELATAVAEGAHLKVAT